MITLSNAENALKTLYLGVVAEQLNTAVNPFLGAIEKTTSDVWGKQVVKLASYGVNGGIGAGSETGTLPEAGANNYAQMTVTLKNLYGKIELSDKAMLASQNDAGAFVDILNAEMDGLLKSSKFNLGRMLYGNGTGKIATVTTKPETNTNNADIAVTSVKNLIEGLIVDVYSAVDATTPALTARRIIKIDRAAKIITIGGTTPSSAVTAGFITVQNSLNQELTGLGAIFDGSVSTLYGLNKADNYWLVPYTKTLNTTISISAIQEVIDNIEELGGEEVNYILSSYAVKRAYLAYLNTNRRNIDYLNLDGGFRAISYNGIPVVADRFCEDNSMFFLNSKNFTMHQLCDWRWLEGEGGKVIRQIAGTPTYSATLVKYAELLCDKPIGQGKLTGITIA